MRVLLFVALAFACVAAVPKSVYFCNVRLPDYCGNSASCPPEPLFSHLAEDPSASFFDYNLVSFGNVNTLTGDVEGRAATRDNWSSNIDSEYSIGYEIQNFPPAQAKDRLRKFSWIVGGDAEAPKGMTIMPPTNKWPLSKPEDGWVGGSYTTSNSQQQNIHSGKCGAAGCLNQDFDDAKAFHKFVQDKFFAQTPNAFASIFESQIKVTCTGNPTPPAGGYVLELPASLTGYNYIIDGSCNPNAQWVINLKWDNPAQTQYVFNGGFFGAKPLSETEYLVPPESILWNIKCDNGQKILNGNSGSGTLLAPECTYGQDVENGGFGVWWGRVIVGNVETVRQINRFQTCTKKPLEDDVSDVGGPSDCPEWTYECPTTFNFLGSTAQYKDYNVISFGNFTGNTGDVEGRLAVKHDFSVGNGFSVGYEVQNFNGPDAVVDYSLVVGNDGTWGSGALFPDGSNLPYPGTAEYAFVGETFTAPQDLLDRRTGDCGGNPGCLDSTFQDAYTCFKNTASSISAKTPNAEYYVKYQAIVIICKEAALEYVLNLDGADLSAATWWAVSSTCTINALWYINVGGEGDVTFQGGNFPAPHGIIVYNIEGSGRNINVLTEVAGSILGPDNYLVQTGGVVKGQVVVGDVKAFLQVNKPKCVLSGEFIDFTTYLIDPVAPGAAVLPVEVSGGLQTGDTGKIQGEEFQVVEANDKFIKISAPLQNGYPAGTQLKVTVDAGNGYRGPSPVKDESAASAVHLSFALLAALLFAAML